MGMCSNEKFALIPQKCRQVFQSENASCVTRLLRAQVYMELKEETAVLGSYVSQQDSF